MPWVGLLSDKTKHSMRGLGRRTVMGGGGSSESPQESPVLSWAERKAWSKC